MGINPAENIIVALDFDRKEQVADLLNKLSGKLKFVKVGMQLFYSEGPAIIDFLLEQNLKIFLDLKLHDIPNTVVKSSLNLAKLGVHMITIHAAGGTRMIESVRNSFAEHCASPPAILAVTQLTSLDQNSLNQEQRITGTIESQVLHLAKLAQNAGADGVIASGLEASLLRKECGEDFLIVTPGVRMNPSNIQDQARVTSPREALQNGANYLVVGREVTLAENPEEIFEKLVQLLMDV